MNATVMNPVLTAVFSDQPDHVWGWGWGPGPWFLIFPLLFWTAVIVALVVTRRRWRGHSGESTLADVFARGEISEAEYRARLAVLRENRR